MLCELASGGVHFSGKVGIVIGISMTLAILLGMPSPSRSTNVQRQEKRIQGIRVAVSVTGVIRDSSIINIAGNFNNC